MYQDHSARPLLIAIFGMALLCSMDAVVKGMPAGTPTLQIVCLRFLATGALLGIWLAIARPGWPRRATLGIHALRAVTMVLAATTFFYALARIPLAELFVISLTSPLFIALFGALFLREGFRARIALAIAVGFGGVLVVAAGDLGRGGGLAIDPWALGAAILSPITYGASIVLLRVQSTQERPEVIVFTQSLLAGFMTAPIVGFDFVPLDLNLAVRFAAVGLLGASGYICFARALSMTTAGRFSVIEYTSLIWATLFGYAFFNEIPRPAVWLGAVLIIGACVMVMRDKAATPAKA
jgi:S-adenosylmethionine uptake transporter